uniref:Uncharacterized protein n=1 Tax=viral metagenome TaxID=1070528 RepID=A0A6M3IWU8_9ZZZZ
MCFNCSTEHKADSKHFPRQVMEKLIGKEGKEEIRVVGYLCRKCVVAEMIKEANKQPRKGVITIK